MQAPEPQDWECLKHILRALYIGKGKTLQGPDGVMKIMETRHGLKATKAQYEKKFKDWGFRKNRTKQDWKVMDRKIGARKRIAKESNVYLDGQLIPMKKISRQAYMTVSEQFHQAQEPSPATPPGFEIRTPVATPMFRLVFENLPIFGFQDIMPQLKDLLPLEVGSSALTPFLGKLERANSHDSVLPIINSLFSNSAFLEEPCAEGIAIEIAEKMGSVQFFNLMAFLISNNFPGESTSRNIYTWLKKHSPPFILQILATSVVPTTEALFDNIFRCAVEAGDVPVVRHLIRAGVSPKEHVCRHPSLPDHVTPLQFALCRGNIQLAQELIKAGSSIDEVGAGWKSSALVLAIIGSNVRDDLSDWWIRDDSSDIGSENNADLDIWSLFEPIPQDFAAHGANNGPLFALIQSLMSAGADINTNGIVLPCVLEQHLGSPFVEGHSPLTAASKYRHKQLFDVFLQRGAEIRFLTGGEATALHECLYSWEDMFSDNEDFGSPQPLPKRKSSMNSLSSEVLSNLIGVARSLTSAGAEVNDESGFCFKPRNFRRYEECENGSLYCTTFDLGVLTGSVELVGMMLCAGAYTTTKISIEYAIGIGSIELFSQLLSSGAPISIQAIGNLMENEETWSFVIPILEKRPNIRIKRAIFQQAIRVGATSVMEYILKTEPSNLQILSHNMTKAFEKCCADGHMDTIRLLLNNFSTSNLSISSWIGRAIELTIENNHDDILDILLSADLDIDVIAHRESVLLVALLHKNTRMIKKLIEGGMSWNKGTNYCQACKGKHESNDVFIAAIKSGDYYVINKLLDAGASLHALGTTNLGFKLCILPLTAAIIAKDSILVNHFIFAGASLNNPPQIPKRTPTPLSTAAANRDFELVNLLIQRGSNPFDSIALSEATSDFRLLQTLLLGLHNYKEPNKEPNEHHLGREALFNAIEKQNLVMARAILDSPIRYMNSIRGLQEGLARAVHCDRTPNLEMIRTFLNLIADLTHSSEIKFDLHDCIDSIGSGFCEAIRNNDSRKVELFLEACACLDERMSKHKDRSGINSATIAKSPDTSRELLRFGMELNTYPKFRYGTPLERAIEDSDVETIRILLKYGAEPNTSFEELSHTPLQMASRIGSREVVELLLEHGADVNAPPAKSHGATALQFAARQGLLGIAFLLIENEAEVNAAPAEIEGRTALEGAAEHGRLDMVQLLINAGASISGEGRAQYENALKRASENGYSAVRRLLESYHG